jgi:LuxR family transcriptional regulator, quorum-sensing system regulator BjaR1
LATQDPGVEIKGVLDAHAFNLQLRRLADVDACTAAFTKAIAPFGFDTFACGELNLAVRERSVFYAIGWPEHWRRFYLSSGLIDRDPVVDALRHRHEPFTWSDLRRDRKLSQLGRKALALVAEQGWVEGLVVPVWRGGDRAGLVSMVGTRVGLEPEAQAYLCLISMGLHTYLRSMASRLGFAEPPAGLTPREIECLKLVAAGATDRDIGERLAIATTTAHEHIEKAKHKLRVRSRASAVAVAVSLGVVDI